MQSITYENLFVKPFENSLKVDETIMDMMLNDKCELLYDYMLSIGCEYYYLDDFMILQAIKFFTLKDVSDETLENNINLVKNEQDVKSVEVSKDEKYDVLKLVIKRESDLIEVLPFSKLVPESLTYIPNLEDESREGNCYDLATTLADKTQMKARVVTGYFYGLTDKSKFLHSWVETKLDGKEVVIDLVFNAVFNKEGYYSLIKARKLEEIDFKDYRMDIEEYLINLNDCVDTLPLETYLSFRSEIIKDLKKNEKIYKILN